MNERIRQIRASTGLSQADFAAKLNIPRGSYGKYETGENKPVSAVITLICKTFGVSEAWLRRGEGDMFVDDARKLEVKRAVDDAFADESDDFKRRWFEIGCDLTDEQWALLKEIAVKMLRDQPELSETAKKVLAAVEAEDEAGSA